MTGTCITKLGHTCGSTDALQVFENEDKTLTGFCFSCNTYVPDPLGKGKTINDIPKEKRLGKTKEEIRAELDEIETYGSFDLAQRRLRKAYLDYYDVKIGVSETDGRTPRLVYFPYTKDGQVVRYKVRLLEEKRMWNIAEDNDVDLFGWEQALKSGSKRLIITEGEFDTVAGHAVCSLYSRESFKDYQPAFVSLINGSSGIKDLSRLSKKIRKHFKDISFCFDNDEQGKKATQEALKIFPEATVIDLPGEKDLNDCLMNGKGKAAYASITFRHEKPVTTRVVNGQDLAQAARTRPEYGLSWPWPGLTKKTRGIRRKETYYFGAGVKMGKSEIVNDLARHIITEHGNPVLLCKPEEDKVKSFQMVAGKVAGKIFHDPDKEFDFDAYDQAVDIIGDKCYIIDNYQFVNWEHLKDDIRQAVLNHGIKDIIIDPVTCFTAGMSASETNEFLIGWAADLSAMAKELDFTAYIFCHLKAPDNGPPHEKGGEVLSTQFTGSRAMMRSCNLMIGIEGNKDAELPPMERNVRKLKILEDRNLGVTGIIKLYWNDSNGLFSEMDR